MIIENMETYIQEPEVDTVQQLPNPFQHVGKIFKVKSNNKRYRSNGSIWIELPGPMPNYII